MDLLAVTALGTKMSTTFTKVGQPMEAPKK